MTHRLVWGLLATMALAAPARAADQAAIKKAIDRGVEALRKLQTADGTWPNTYIGATALAGLALLECEVPPDDKAVQRAAEVIRRAAVNNLTHTYSISLSMLFLDRLGDPGDVPLIESLMVRLLAGQNANTGGWTYNCPSISAEEVRRLEGLVKDRKKAPGRTEEKKPAEKRKVDDLPPEIKDQLRRLGRGDMIADRPGPGLGNGVPVPNWQAGQPPPVLGGPGDNSNTQFAALGIWVGRRHGLPVEDAITRLARRFRTTQMDDGGWSYTSAPPPPGVAAHMPDKIRMVMGASASMTCAGVLALAICDGATLEYYRERKPDAKLPDIFSKDKNLSRGLEALGAVIGDTKGLMLKREGYHPDAPAHFRHQPDRVGGKTYYFLFSLERVAMALDLKTISKKDWYGWGSEILLENQTPEGLWIGEYSEGGVDTSFALLFLKRANLLRDLTAHIQGKFTDPGERTLSGGLGLNKARANRMKSGIESMTSRPLDKPAPKAMDPDSARLTDVLLKAAPTRRMGLLDEMESGKGAKYTEALAAAIPKLEGEAHRKAREALANRLTRMKDETLAEYLQDDDPEIRRAAALAIGQKESKALIPNLIGLLHDPETSVVRAAHASLKALTDQDFGPSAKAPREERDQAVLKWVEWWSKQAKK